jgi:glycerol-3-phosphate acyltransferase PlsX
VAGAREYGLAIDLVGPSDILTVELRRQHGQGLPIEIVHAPEVVGMAEAPAVAVRQKRNSSLVVGASSRARAFMGWRFVVGQPNVVICHHQIYC